MAGRIELRGQMHAAGVDGVRETPARRLDLLGSIEAARVNAGGQGITRRFQRLVNLCDALEQCAGGALARVIDAAGHVLPGAGKPVHDFAAARGQLVQHVVTGPAQGDGDFLAFAAQRGGDPVARLADPLGQPHANRLKLARQAVMGCADGTADAVRIADNRLTLARQLVNQRADAALIVAVGALQVRDLAAHHRLKLAGACQRPLNAIAHGGNLAPDGLGQRQNLVAGNCLRLNQADRHLAH